MNIEIANRLVNLRKTNNLSQEALAEKLGISRQAVSKWERAEASPDTDNLILLARLYGISLDDLLKTDDEIPRKDESSADSKEEDEGKSKKRRKDYVNVSLKGVHVIDEDGTEVRVGWDGVYVDDASDNTKVEAGMQGVFVDGVEYENNWCKRHGVRKFPVAIIIVCVYILISVFFDLWHPGWLIFLLIPIWHTLFEAIHKKNAHIFAYPVVVSLIYLLLGFTISFWHPGWVLFLTIPLYYSFVSYIRSWKRDKNNEPAKEENEDIIDI